jgi:thiamine biosynthesis lipoprotein ApbE
LKAIGIESYCVNASGNMVFGESPKPTVQGWPVSIGLVDQPDRSLCSVRLSKCGIATSGDLHQKYRDRPSVTDNQQRSSHIVDPAQQRGLVGSLMATVITGDATSADAFATACCVQEHGSWASSPELTVTEEISRFGYKAWLKPGKPLLFCIGIRQYIPKTVPLCF